MKDRTIQDNFETGGGAFPAIYTWRNDGDGWYCLSVQVDPAWQGWEQKPSDVGIDGWDEIQPGEFIDFGDMEFIIPEELQ